MDRLRAIKNDYDPFPPRVSLRASLFAIFRCTAYRCPYCRWLFKITWGPSNSLLGPGERRCWHCKQLFWDGSDEWPEMNGKARQLFLVPITIGGYIAAILVIAGLYAFARLGVKQSGNWGDLIFFVTLVIPILLWFCFRGVQVIRSVHRYNNRVPQGPS